MAIGICRYLFAVHQRHTKMLRYRGFGVVELLFSMTISLVVMLALLSYFANSTAVNRVDPLSGQVTAVASGVLDFMARELQMSGYNGKAEEMIGSGMPSPFGILEVIGGSCIVYSYDENGDGKEQTSEARGFRASTEGAIEYGQAVNGGCDEGVWRPIAPPSVKFTKLVFRKNATIALAESLDIERRAVSIELTAVSAKETKLHMSLNRFLYVLNDVLIAKKKKNES